MAFKLSTVLRGHELDIRAVCPAVFPQGGILTASRDRTTRVWVPEGLTFTEGHVLAGHQNFISAVCTLPVSDKNPHGKLILRFVVMLSRSQTQDLKMTMQIFN